MKINKAIISLCFAVFFIPNVFAASVSGTWTTIDDKTGVKRSVVRLVESGGQISGRIIEVYPQPGDTGICSKCPNNFKDKQIKGLRFLWGLKKKNDNTWDDGTILDPKSGKLYRAKITLDGNKLFVRGYIGFSLIGRTQIWTRN